MEAYIYGAGSMGVNSIKVLLENGVKIKAIIDKNINLIGKRIDGVDIISLNDIPDLDKINAIFAVAVNKFPFNEIKNALESIGCKNVIYVGDLINSVYSGPSIANTWELKDVTEEEEKKLKFVYNNYFDENSKAAFRQSTKWLKDRVEEVEDIAMCDFDSKYFIDKVCEVLKENEIFIDCGSYDGVSIAKMLKYTNNHLNKIYAFEPNVENYSKLNNYIKENNLEDKKYDIGTKLIMKKQHPCGENLWEVVRLGADIKIKCLGCSHVVMLPRVEFNKKIKKIVSLSGDKDE